VRRHPLTPPAGHGNVRLTSRATPRVAPGPYHISPHLSCAARPWSNRHLRYWTLGRFDAVAIFEAPDDETATRLMPSVGSLGNIRTETLRAYSAKEMGEILKGMK